MVLIEALVGMLIFMVGVLGLVGLQAAMTRAQTTAKMRGEAMLLANELVGMIWADKSNLAQYSNTGGATACSANARCNDWVQKVAATLPSGAGTVTTNGGTVTVSVSWSTSVEGTRTYAMVTSIQ
ncbi:MAG TPA: pilus assembly protein PilV [Ramlibacter sp.]|uniref:type IV pilus modification PilV family protein n=1 Tax=Ramlibacter sp. TaxID=1917967 RepID=UPI002BE92333|nr:pilus assembly protein PilV [Ramlibacter sp.]HVZ46841.1 pilus assembly protein PilV [Ramlibacter sp.]